MIYKIQKGSHYSGFRIGFTPKRSVKFIGFFYENCLYNHGDADNYDVNKLFGITPFWKHHHNVSARMGWRSIDGEKIQLLSYCYNNKERLEPTLMATVEPYQDFTFMISDKDHFYEIVLELEGKRTVKNSPKSKTICKWSRYLWPYFGGNKVAPHNMTIDLKKIN